MSAFWGRGSSQSMAAAPRDIGPTATRQPRFPRASVSVRAWRTAAAAFGLMAVRSGDWAAGRMRTRRIAVKNRFMVSMLGRGRDGFKRSHRRLVSHHQPGLTSSPAPARRGDFDSHGIDDIVVWTTN